jgi:hypothetical protein
LGDERAGEEILTNRRADGLRTLARRPSPAIDSSPFSVSMPAGPGECIMKSFRAGVTALLVNAAPAMAQFEPPVVDSGSPDFDRACVEYYSQGNDPDVAPDDGMPQVFCVCLAEAYEMKGLGTDALDFFARTYSEDLTTFIDEYPQGERWMKRSFEAEHICKTSG